MDEKRLNKQLMEDLEIEETCKQFKASKGSTTILEESRWGLSMISSSSSK